MSNRYVSHDYEPGTKAKFFVFHLDDAGRFQGYSDGPYATKSDAIAAGEQGREVHHVDWVVGVVLVVHEDIKVKPSETPVMDELRAMADEADEYILNEPQSYAWDRDADFDREPFN